MPINAIHKGPPLRLHFQKRSLMNLDVLRLVYYIFLKGAYSLPRTMVGVKGQFLQNHDRSCTRQLMGAKGGTERQRSFTQAINTRSLFCPGCSGQRHKQDKWKGLFSGRQSLLPHPPCRGKPLPESCMSGRKRAKISRPAGNGG